MSHDQPTAYEARRAQRVAGLRAAAERRASEASAAFEAARVTADAIPMGQPVLVGHHSEARHRRDAARIERNMRKGVELAAEAKGLARRADAAERSTAISSDDPDAIQKLDAEIARREADQARMVEVNKVIRRSKNVRADLAAMGLSESMIENLLRLDELGNIGFAPYQITNNGADIRRLKARRAELAKRAAAPTPEPVPFPGGTIVEEDNRVRVRFDARASDELCKALRGHGFVWSPTSSAWQRKASIGAWYWAKRIVGLEVA